MNHLPLISICVPTYNAVQFIEETISCFIKQTHENWELIIQDDCSNDGTWELLSERYNNDKKIRLYQNNQNLGIGKNWNEAYNKARGEYIVIFNADDLVSHDFLAQGIKHFKIYPEIDLVISSYLKSTENKDEELILITKSYKGITQDLININKKPFYRISWNYTLAKKISLDKLKNGYGLFYPTQVCDSMLWYECYRQKLTAYYTGNIAGIYRMHDANNSKIPLAEFESTLLWMIPTYPDIFKMKNKVKWSSGLALLIKYLYSCLKHSKKPKLAGIRNIVTYV